MGFRRIQLGWGDESRLQNETGWLAWAHTCQIPGRIDPMTLDFVVNITAGLISVTGAVLIALLVSDQSPASQRN